MTEIPEHRAGVTPRDGDTRVIEGGKIRNVDAEARDREAKKVAGSRAAEPKTASPAKAPREDK